MAILKLTGKEEEYLFDPENESTVLKRNGKFGSVYAGVKVSDESHVVIKFLSPELNQYPDAVKQFRLEADLNLVHAHLRKTYEFIEAEDNYFLIQEYINGTNLKTFLQQNSKHRNSIQFILKSAINILDALNYLHSQNIIHCDIKPANILIEHSKNKRIDENNPPVKLIDFGQAKTILSNFTVATKPFSLIYSPPEQVLHFHDLINPSSDLYALGITIYELIAGKNPFDSTHPEMLMHKQVSGDMIPDEKISNELFKILQIATAKNKFPLPPNRMEQSEQRKIVSEGMKKRFQTASEMKNAFENFLSSFSERKNFFSKIFR